MHDLRLYRLALVPAFLALFVCAFALENRPSPVTTPLTADAFDGARAFGPGEAPPRDSLRELAATFPDRRPGSAGDARLADRVAAELARQGFQVTRSAERGDTADGRRDLETVVGVRPGLSSRRIVVLAHRDATGSPALAELSGTAALLELARVSRIRDFRRTLVLVSTSGGSAGAAGARAWARGARGAVDGAIVLGDLASAAVRRPWVVPWSLAGRPAPPTLRRTVEAAVRQEIRADPGNARAGGQWVRRAVPVTVSEQGPVVAEGVPAVLLSATGERGPAGPRAPVSQARLDEFGRAALRAVTALDQAPERALPGDRDGIVTLRKFLPTWAVRLLVGALLLPALLVAVDGFFRARRRHTEPERWIAWALAGALPFLLAWGWARMLDLTTLVAAPPAPARDGAVPLDAAGVVALASVVVVVLVGWFGLRPLLLRAAGHHGDPAADAGAAGGVGLLLVLLVGALWIATPYAAALLLPAAHLWIFAIAPDTRMRGWRAVFAFAAGLVLPALVVVYYASALGTGVAGLAWLAFLSAAGGTLALPGALSLSLLAGTTLAVMSILLHRRRLPPARAAAPAPPRISRHVGPGSLGGTPSALRR